MTPYGDRKLGQHWPRYWLVAWRHQAITWTNVDFSSIKSCGVHVRTISQEIPQPSITKISLKITSLKCIKFLGSQWAKINFAGMFCAAAAPWLEVRWWWVNYSFSWYAHGASFVNLRFRGSAGFLQFLFRVQGACAIFIYLANAIWA